MIEIHIKSGKVLKDHFAPPISGSLPQKDRCFVFDVLIGFQLQGTEYALKGKIAPHMPVDF